MRKTKPVENGAVLADIEPLLTPEGVRLARRILWRLIMREPAYFLRKPPALAVVLKERDTRRTASGNFRFPVGGGDA
ncbi:MAG TPA: hypothetical protein VH253_10885 [Phycisphaerae bacterium]|nr:hypothetical protein [Phycisphaerae bacterium]